jgi:hypothetical protein
MKHWKLSPDLERCKPWIEAALVHCNGTHEWDDIVAGIASSKMQLWAAPRGCIVTEIVVYPRKKVINIFLAGGELDQIMDMEHDIGQWAKSHGCTGGMMTGRLGWKKPLTENGWKLQHVSFHKEIENV